MRGSSCHLPPPVSGRCWWNQSGVDVAFEVEMERWKEFWPLLPPSLSLLFLQHTYFPLRQDITIIIVFSSQNKSPRQWTWSVRIKTRGNRRPGSWTQTVVTDVKNMLYKIFYSRHTREKTKSSGLTLELCFIHVEETRWKFTLQLCREADSLMWRSRSVYLRKSKNIKENGNIKIAGRSWTNLKTSITSY